MAYIEIVKKSIAHMDMDCIVVPSSQDLNPTGGAAEAVFRAAGYDELKNACDKIKPCAVGDFVVTPGFRLKAQYIFHAVGPSWIDGKHHEQNRLRDCYRKTMRKAKELGCTSIAFPLISTGLKGYPLREAWAMAIRTILSEESNLKVYFAVLDDYVYDIGQEILLYSSIDAEIFRIIDRHMLQKNIKNVCHLLVASIGNIKENIEWGWKTYPTHGFDPTNIILTLCRNRKYKEALQSLDYMNTLHTNMSAAEVICKLHYYQREEQWNGLLCISEHIINGDTLKLLLRLDDLYVAWYEE